MSRRAPIVVVAIVAVLLAVAAASAPVRLWVVPNLSSSTSSNDPAEATIGPTSETDRAEEPSSEPAQGFATLFKTIMVAVTIAAVGALIALRSFWPTDWQRARGRTRSSGRFSPLPDVAETTVGIDVRAARAALATGQPRSAIVACWIRLESDIAAIGWPRAEAETSAEYVQRVVAEASVDRLAISELAELYREARFSDHELSDADRAHAFEALSRVEAGLRSGERVLA